MVGCARYHPSAVIVRNEVAKALARRMLAYRWALVSNTRLCREARGLTLLPHQPGMKDAKDYDLASTHGFEMPLEILVLDKSEEIVCHSFSCCWTQSHMVCICFVAFIVLS